MELNLIRIVITLVSLVIFLLIVAWAYRPANRDRFNADALIALQDDPASGGRSAASE